MISVIVPAHDEEGRVGRCVHALVDGVEPDRIEVIVVANGCRDGTAREAAEAGSTVKVLELPTASKVAALNAGEAVASGFPRFYVDADVVIPYAELLTVADVLVPDRALLAAPQREWLTDGSPWLVRSYLRVLEELPQVRASLTGGGVLGVSKLGRHRFATFPDVIADDLFLESRFGADEKVVVEAAHARVEMPRTLRGLITRRTRVVLANREARGDGDARGGRWGNLMAALRRKPMLVRDLPVFLAVTLLAEIRASLFARRGELAWQRDDSTR